MSDLSPLENKLIDWTVNHPRLNSRERYIGLSKIGDCPLANYHMYFNHGYGARDENLMLKFWIGYAAEDDVVARLRGVGHYQPGIAISLCNGMVQGHTDGSLDGRLVEIKSVAEDAHFPDGRLPHKVWWQVQAYLRYTQFTEAYVIYLSRSTGRLKVYEVCEDRGMGRRIHQRVLALVKAIRDQYPPACECGRCL